MTKQDIIDYIDDLETQAAKSDQYFIERNKYYDLYAKNLGLTWEDVEIIKECLIDMKQGYEEYVLERPENKVMASRVQSINSVLKKLGDLNVE